MTTCPQGFDPATCRACRAGSLHTVAPMKYGTFTFGTTPEPVIRDAFADEDTGGFYWDLRGSDSRNAERLDLHRIDESKVEGFIKIIDRLADPGVYLRLEDDDVLWDWAPSLRADMLASIEIEEI